jgi:hypothetical protein
MQPNPGGRLALADIVGRTREIERYWQILERQSLILGAERRIGKSHIVWKMHGDGRAGFLTFYQDLEAVHGILELVRELYRTISPRLTRVGRLKGAAISAWDALLPKRYGELDLPDAAKNWKTLLRTSVDDVLGVADPSEKVVIIWDELPLMLHNIQRRDSPEAAIQLLDLLRQLRQMNAERLRFVFTGSVGLHIVLRALRAAGGANDPTNDMQTESVPPMRVDEAFDLSRRTLAFLPDKAPNVAAIATRMVEQVGGYPYFLHHVADQLSQYEVDIVPSDVDRVTARLIESDEDPAHFNYYLSRIHTYYDPVQAAAALAVLDTLALQDTAIQLCDIGNLARHRADDLRDEQVRNTLLLLRQDHYVTTTDATCDFRWRILKRWWRRARG